MIQTKVLVGMLKSLNFDMEPKDIKRPSGKENKSVSANSFSVTRNP